MDVNWESTRFLEVLVEFGILHVGKIGFSVEDNVGNRRRLRAWRNHGLYFFIDCLHFHLNFIVATLHVLVHKSLCSLFYTFVHLHRINLTCCFV